VLSGAGLAGCDGLALRASRASLRACERASTMSEAETSSCGKTTVTVACLVLNGTVVRGL